MRSSLVPFSGTRGRLHCIPAERGQCSNEKLSKTFLLAFFFFCFLFLLFFKYKLMNDFITVPERKRYWFPVLKIRTGFCLNSQTLLDHFSRVLVITIIPTHIPCQIALQYTICLNALIYIVCFIYLILFFSTYQTFYDCLTIS